MSKKVFMSYSWRDSNIATRIYNDLIRSQVKIWRDQIDGDPIEDFQKEFLSKIDECDYFLLLDSTNYRMRSKWCYTELSRCIENQNRRNAPRIIVCLLEADGNWRTNYTNKNQENLFTRINTLKYHNFYFSGYDNNNTYKQSISDICTILGLSFIPWGDMPNNQDLMDELFYIQDSEINKDDANCIMEEYHIILNKIKKERYNNLRTHFRIWIDDCKALNLNLYFPEWTYAIWLANNENINDMYESANILKTLINEFPNDPRAYRGIGCLDATLNKYDDALKYLLKAYELVQLEANNHQKDYCEFEILYNISQSYINIGKFHDALTYLHKGYELMIRQETFNIDIIKNIDFASNMYGVNIKERIKFLNDCIYKFPLESEIYKLIGLCFIDEKDYNSAHNALSKAYSLSPCAETAFHLLCQMINLNLYTEYNNLVHEIFSLENNCPEDDYWKGAIAFFLESNTNKAKYYFEKCDQSQFRWYQEI